MLGALLIDFFFPNSSKNPEVEDRVCATSNNLKYLTREKEKKKARKPQSCHDSIHPV